MLDARRAAGVALLGAVAASACHTPDATERTAKVDLTQVAAEQGDQPRALPADPAHVTHRWSWGDGPAELALIPRGYETVASGPSAVALTPGATPLILDRLAGRVVRVTEAGRLMPLASVAVDAEELATSADGSLLTYSPLRATAWLYDAQGQAAGELPVSRALHQLLHVELGPSRTVQVRTGYQELIDVGSPAAPLPLAVALKTKKEGAALSIDGRGLSASVTDGQAELRIIRQATAEQHAAVEMAFPITGSVTAARLVGTFGKTACLRLERVESTPEITVSRRAFCMDITDGTVTFDRDLPAPGLYVPRRELAVGGGHLAFIHPTEEGLTLHRWRLERRPGAASGTVDPVTADPTLQPASSKEVQP